jgi:uncharacterized membrane protein YdbT with pleckstrin-like domain
MTYCESVFSLQPRRIPEITDWITPAERAIHGFRLHPAAVAKPFLALLAGTLVAGVASGTILAGRGSAQILIWILWTPLLGWAAYRYAKWRGTYFIVTGQRIILIIAFLGRRSIATMPLSKVNDMLVQRSITARVWGYATFVVETAGSQQALRRIDFVAYPKFVYREMMLRAKGPLSGDMQNPDWADEEEPGAAG